MTSSIFLSNKKERNHHNDALLQFETPRVVLTLWVVLITKRFFVGCRSGSFAKSPLTTGVSYCTMKISRAHTDSHLVVVVSIQNDRAICVCNQWRFVCYGTATKQTASCKLTPDITIQSTTSTEMTAVPQTLLFVQYVVQWWSWQLINTLTFTTMTQKYHFFKISNIRIAPKSSCSAPVIFQRSQNAVTTRLMGPVFCSLSRSMRTIKSQSRNPPLCPKSFFVVVVIFPAMLPLLPSSSFSSWVLYYPLSCGLLVAIVLVKHHHHHHHYHNNNNATTIL